MDGKKTLDLQLLKFGGASKIISVELVVLIRIYLLQIVKVWFIVQIKVFIIFRENITVIWGRVLIIERLSGKMEDGSIIMQKLYPSLRF